ncbi:hypothetical protein SDJN02_06876, partial [Cucurbita argyrosperma subsp. argyrosperma]
MGSFFQLQYGSAVTPELVVLCMRLIFAAISILGFGSLSINQHLKENSGDCLFPFCSFCVPFVGLIRYLFSPAHLSFWLNNFLMFFFWVVDFDVAKLIRHFI